MTIQTEASNVVPITTKPPIRAPKVMLVGDSGVGKTHSCRSLVEAGMEVFCVFTEPGFESVLGDLPADKLHWHYLPPMPLNWDTLGTQLEAVGKMSFEMLTKMTGARGDFQQILQLVTLMKNYKCQRTGKEYGDVTRFGNDKWVWLDTLSGLSMMSQNSVTGTKPMMNQGEFALAQGNIEKFVNTCCMNLTCGFTLVCHAERETNELTGGVSIMASTLGKKLAPKLPRFFDDVIYAAREGEKFLWQTQALNTLTKNKHVPFSAAIVPSFVPLIAEWRKKTMQTV